MSDGPRIFLAAAEASGDHHAAGLVRALRRRYPTADLVGVAGPEMRAAGCRTVEDLTQQAQMLGGAILALPRWLATVKRLQRAVRDNRPDVFVPVDSPALNWHLCKAARTVDARILHYVSPQVWAWATWRVGKLRGLTDRVACILPFEQDYLRERGVPATFVGHPLFDELSPTPDEAALPDLTEAWIDGRWRVALLPGSRPVEIARHAMPLRQVAERIVRRWPHARCTFTALDATAADRIATACDGRHPEIAVGRTSEVLARSHIAVAASGTVTLQVAHFGVPMVVLYGVGGFERAMYRLIVRHLLHTRWLSLPNIVAGRQIVPELMPWHGDDGQLWAMVEECMNDYGWLCQTRRRLLELSRSLHAPDGSAAETTAALLADLRSARKRRWQ
ncbi:MAG: lipid-A-disaccharide synthase [Planctomycetes bacterium]|nr:lipid-A-disaccharide synthase [Planctomycetota bacterium]